MIRSPRLIFVTQLIDPLDPILGFSVGWVGALAERCERLVVIANEVRNIPNDLGAQVLSLGKERGVSRLGRGATYIKHLSRLLPRLRPHALFAHMCPQYLNAAAPMLRLYGIPGVLWFAHPQDSRTLRIAERVADRVLTSLPGAFPFSSPKVQVIGQGINIGRFRSLPRAPGGERLELLALGRLSPVKGYEPMVDAVRKLAADGVPLRLQIVGPATTSREHDYAVHLQTLVAEAGDAVSLCPPVTPDGVHALLASADIVINGTRAGSGDKSVFEAMAAKRPVIYCNPSFDHLTEGLPLTLRYQENNPDALARVIRALWEAGAGLRADLGETLAARVAKHHSIEGWAERVMETVAAIARAG